MGKYKCIEQCYWGPTNKRMRTYEFGEIYIGDLPRNFDGSVNKYFVDTELKQVEEEVAEPEVAEKQESVDSPLNDMTKREICTKYGIELSANDFRTTKKADLIAMALGE